MKKLLLSIFALSTYMNVNAQCSDIFISEYVEGLSNNKALGIFNPTPNAINLNGKYRLIRYNNGTTAAAGEANSQAIINLGNHVIASGDEWVLVIDQRDSSGTGQTAPVDHGLWIVADTFLCPDYNVSYSMYFNGNDALSIQKTNDGGATWNYVDIFGMMGDAAMVSGVSWSDQFPYDGSVGAWWTRNHTLIRKPNVQQGITVNPSPEFIVTTEWDSLPVDTFDHLGTHTCTCPTHAGISEIDNSVKASIYPNPSKNNSFTITSAEPVQSIEVINLLGETIITKGGNKNSLLMKVETPDLPKGIYTIKMYFANNKVSVSKLIKQ